MKKLYLLRHGKASAPNGDQSDFDRPLNKKGISQINLVGSKLSSTHTDIDQIIHSSAKRTIETAEITNYHLDVTNINSSSDLYLADEKTIFEYLKTNSKGQSVLYVGHNFGISNLAGELAGHTISMTTGMLIEFEIDINDWSSLAPHLAEMKSTFAPNVLVP